MAAVTRRRAPSRFELWAWSPVIVLRVSLVMKYVGFVYLSAIAFLAGVPILSLTTPEGYTLPWAFVLGTAAMLAAVGSTSARWEVLEKWSALVVVATMGAYAIAMNWKGFAEHDLPRQFAGGVAALILILPATRFLWLAAQSGKKKANPATHGVPHGLR